MAYRKNFLAKQFGHEFPNAYHRLSVDDRLAHYGVIVANVDVFASKEAAAAPPLRKEIATDADGNQLYVDEQGNPMLLSERSDTRKPVDYVWVDVPSTERSVGQPIGSYQVQIWNRQPAERRNGDGGPPFVVDATAFAGLIGKGDPVSAPAGTSNKEKFAPKAQAYRLVRSLADFSDAIDEK